MFRRRPLMRAAVVGGGAYLAGKHVANRQADEAQYAAEQDARISALEQQQAGGGQYDQPPQYQQPPQQAPPPPAPAASSSMVDQLNQLAGLHEQGVLTDDEFAAAKAKLFGT
jgi:putative oligomerization/nucleic acid binding protein